MSAETFLGDIGKAADDLGFGIESIDLGQVVLRPHGKNLHWSVVIQGRVIVITGDTLREILRPQPKRVEESR